MGKNPNDEATRSPKGLEGLEPTMEAARKATEEAKAAAAELRQRAATLENLLGKAEEQFPLVEEHEETAEEREPEEAQKEVAEQVEAPEKEPKKEVTKQETAEEQKTPQEEAEKTVTETTEAEKEPAKAEAPQETAVPEETPKKEPEPEAAEQKEPEKQEAPKKAAEQEEAPKKEAEKGTAGPEAAEEQEPGKEEAPQEAAEQEEAPKEEAKKEEVSPPPGKEEQEEKGEPAAYEDMSLEETLKKLDTDSEKGLSQSEAEERLEKYGLNTLKEEKANPLLKFLGYFWGPIPWMIEVAAALSAAVRHWADLFIIMFLLVFNAVIGFWEEHEASNALDDLKSQLALKAKVRRDDDWKEVKAEELVPGDVIRVHAGDIIPADIKLMKGEYLSVDQSALTGESLPVDKKSADIAYSGSVAKQGEMSAVVTATGESTYFAKTAQLVETAGAVSHFQKAVMRVGDFLIFIALGLSIILIVVELVRGLPFMDLIQFVLILVVASIPVAMPAVLSVTMALGALALSRKKAIVSRLQSIEEMAGIDILCSDKTGTLTQNKLTLGEPLTFGTDGAQEMILAGALASEQEDPDAIDQAVMGALEDQDNLSSYEQVEFVPFDPVHKRTEATVKDGQGKTFKVSKGAPQVIIDLCKLDQETQEKAQNAVDDLAAKGNRTLGVARADKDENWQFLGILPLSDPPREDSAETIAKAEEHGIEVKMITGDDVAIGREIAHQLGMGDKIQPAEQLFPKEGECKLDSDVEKRIEKADGFARVFPEHKYNIVKALQERGHLVGMTGDGVNDAPALKQAEVGIAVSGATNAARSAAALVLTEPGLSVIITAVEEARRIFERMMSYTIYRIAMTIDIMVFVVAAMIAFNYFPLTPIMIIMLALLDDIPIMTIAYDNTYLSPKPVRWEMHRVLTVSSVLGFLAMIQSFGLLLIGKLMLNLDVPHLQTMLFLQLVAGGHLMLFLTRTKKSFWRRPFPSKTLASAIVATQGLAVLITGFGWLVPKLPWVLIGLVWAYNIVWMFGMDIVKLGTYRLIENRAHHKRRFLEFLNRPLHSHQTQ
jgi:H+-transporting ATPase